MSIKPGELNAVLRMSGIGARYRVRFTIYGLRCTVKAYGGRKCFDIVSLRPVNLELRFDVNLLLSLDCQSISSFPL